MIRLILPTLAGAALLAAAGPLRAQVSFFPPLVAVEAGGASGWLELMSASRGPTDLELSLHFAIPVTDSLGIVRLTAPPEQDGLASRSAVPHLRFGPERIRLEAGGTQRVRFVALDRSLPPGEYWARLQIASRPALAPLGTPPPDDGLRAAVQANVNVFIPVFVRAGRTEARPHLDSLTTRIDGDTLVVRPWLTNEGTGAALGLARIELVDGAGTMLATEARHVAVYTAQSPTFALPLPTGAEPALVRFTFSSERPDIPDEARLRFDPVVATAPVRAPR